VLGLLPELENYLESKSDSEGVLLEELKKQTYAQMDRPQMLCGRVESRLLKMLVAILNATRVLEIGTFTGYSALSMAESLPEHGELITLDFDPKAIAFASKFIARSSHAKKIKIIEGPALDSIAKLDGPFDFVFLDADRRNYLNCYHAVLPKVRSGGMIAADNALIRGRVLDPQDESDRGICAFNDYVAQDPSVEKVLLPVRDGLYLIRKR
jgi:caffeoyl-CoA O-methyltransferase